MNKYVVALYSNFYGEMRMKEVEAQSELEAGKAFLREYNADVLDDEYEDILDKIKSYEELSEHVFNMDHAVGIYQVNK